MSSISLCGGVDSCQVSLKKKLAAVKNSSYEMPFTAAQIVKFKGTQPETVAGVIAALIFAVGGFTAFALAHHHVGMDVLGGVALGAAFGSLGVCTVLRNRRFSRALDQALTNDGLQLRVSLADGTYELTTIVK